MEHEGEAEVLLGIRLLPAPGHTGGHQVVVVETEAGTNVLGGDVAVWFAETLLVGAGVTVVALLVAGGVLYNIGAILYGIRWPNPWPTTFGHHEFFHAFTTAAAVCHFVAIWLVVY